MTINSVIHAVRFLFTCCCYSPFCHHHHSCIGSKLMYNLILWNIKISRISLTFVESQKYSWYYKIACPLCLPLAHPWKFILKIFCGFEVIFDNLQNFISLIINYSTVLHNENFWQRKTLQIWQNECYNYSSIFYWAKFEICQSSMCKLL